MPQALRKTTCDIIRRKIINFLIPNLFMSKYFKKADLILLIIILALSVLGFIALRKSSSSSSMIEISVAGETIKTVSLAKDDKYDISTDYGYNIICVKSGQVWVEDANCPNKDCMGFGKISKEGQVILCLPHKLAVKITGNGGSDAISY